MCAFRDAVSPVVQRKNLVSEVRQLARVHKPRKQWRPGTIRSPHSLPATPSELNNGNKIPEAVVERERGGFLVGAGLE